MLCRSKWSIVSWWCPGCQVALLIREMWDVSLISFESVSVIEVTFSALWEAFQSMSGKISRRGSHRCVACLPSTLCASHGGSLGDCSGYSSRPQNHGHFWVNSINFSSTHTLLPCSLPPSPSGILVESRILVFSPNISLRLYPQWAQRLLNLPALPRGEVYKTNDPIEVTVCLYTSVSL